MTESALVDVGPHPFLGGSPSDYTVGVGPSGTFHSRHRASGRAIQSVVPRSGEIAGRVLEGMQIANTLGAANLGVGLLNLGVGIYNAYQLGQVRENLGRLDQKIDSVRADLLGVRHDIMDLGRFTQQSFSLVLKAIHDQGIALGVLIDGQTALAERLDSLRLEIREGFTDLRHMLLATEARRIRQELESRAAVAARHYRVMHDCLSRGVQPSPLELRSVIDSGTTLLAWLDTMLASTAAAEPARLPLLALKTAGTRMVCEARFQERADHPTCDRERAELTAEVSRSALALCDGRSPWDLANGYAPVLAGYVFLHRGLTSHADIGVTPDGEIVPLLPVKAHTWRDGLEALRLSDNHSVSARPGLDEPMALSGPDDERWLAQWHRETVNSETPTARSVLRLLGAEQRPQVEVGEEALRTIRELALTAGRRRLATHLEQEFGWHRAPRVLPGAAVVPNLASPEREGDD